MDIYVILCCECCNFFDDCIVVFLIEIYLKLVSCLCVMIFFDKKEKGKYRNKIRDMKK